MRRPVVGAFAALGLVFAVPAVAHAQSPWHPVAGGLPATHAGAAADVQPDAYRAFTLDQAGLKADLSTAREVGLRSRAAVGPSDTVISLPAPGGGMQRFSVKASPIMEDGLAAAHPEIQTYAGVGIDDPTATLRADTTPLGFHASVRAAKGAWYIDPYYHLDTSAYVSYYGRDVTENPHGLFTENENDEASSDPLGVGAPAAAAAADVQLRTYRLALVTDPSYATYFGGPANVTAAKVTLMNRVDQIYEDEFAIRMILINQNDKLNLNTAADMTERNGPCGAAACYTDNQSQTCSGPTLKRNRIVVGQIIGAANYDIGHIALGVPGGGIAQLGVVGRGEKAWGCTGVPTPVGDLFAVDYVAHEMGHQFAGNHTFNGTQLNCSGGNRNGATSVEPGSGSSIMAYAGICRQDDLQPHSDPYFSERSYDEITNYTSRERPPLDEVQTVSLRDFDTNGDSFTLSYGRATTVPIVRGGNYTIAGITQALQAIMPPGATVAVQPWAGRDEGNLLNVGFQVEFGGTLAGLALEPLVVTGTGATGFVGETVRGGPVQNRGYFITPTGNHPPAVTTAPGYTIPLRTPFALTGSATDADGDALTYMWEQNDIGGATGTALVSNTKKDGPLFRQFGTAANVSATDTLLSPSPGENMTDANPTRVFPDMAQILAGNTNAATGACPTAPPSPAAVPAAIRDCFSEFLPTADWVGVLGDRTLNFRLTARDAKLGGGGVGSAATKLTLAPFAGPFRVTSQAIPQSLYGTSPQTITWDVAGTDVAPVSAANVRITLSTDGGVTFPYVLAASTPNDGSQGVIIPDVTASKARIKIEAIGNVFFDVSHADVAIVAPPTTPVGGTVPATLSLVLGPAPAFGAFTPGLTKDYDASTTATVISTAGDATLSVVDPSSNAPGHLVNGAFSLPSALQAKANSGVFAAVSGSPLTLLTYAGPVSNDVVGITLRQHIESTDPLRTGTYSKTLTYTLSTTNP